jgi:hypothetical protein
MRTPRLLIWLTAYYLGLSFVLLAAVLSYPPVRAFLPIGGVEALLTTPPGDLLGVLPGQRAQVSGFGESLTWLIIALAGSLVAALPVSWTYMEARHRDQYDQSMVETIVILPLVVTGIIVVVHNSLALAFSLAGIAAGVRFRHSLKSPGDVLFILLAIGIGLASGIGAVELGIVLSMAFNYCFLLLWINDYGARKGARRSLRKGSDGAGGDEHSSEPAEPPPSGGTS